LTRAQNNLAIAENLPPRVVLFQMASGYSVSAVIYVATRPRNRRSLEGWPSSCLSGLSYGEASGFPSSVPARARLGVLTKEQNYAFELTPIGASLQSTGLASTVLTPSLPLHRMSWFVIAACLSLAFGQLRRMQGISLLSLLALVFAATPLFSQALVQSIDRAKTLGNQLMCTCGCGDTAGSCSHPGAAFSGPCDVAKGKLKEMNKRIARGESDKQILQAFVEEYGDSAFAAPPARGFNWFAYTFPAIAFATGLVLVLMIFRQWRHRPPQLATASGPAVTPEMLENARSQIKREAQDD
jgi:cytochrome c-type biogenesis protein CcmH/NrfF